MNQLYLFWLLIFSDNVYSFKPDYAVKRQSKSIFSNKKHTETITPARYKVGNRNIKYDHSATDNFMPEHYFPEVEYPTNIMESSKPFYFKTGDNNALFTDFTDEVKTNFKAAAKPTLLKVKRKIGDEYKTQPKLLLKDKAASETLNIETGNSTADLATTFPKNSGVPAKIDSMKLKKTILPETPLDSSIKTQSISEQITSDEKNIFMSEKMISPESESRESIEDMDYANDCSLFCSIENITTGIYNDDQVEKFDSYDSYEDITPTVSECVTKDENSSNNSTLNKNYEPTESLDSLEAADVFSVEVIPLPIETNKTNVGRTAPMRLGIGPVQNVKRRKFLQRMYNTPAIIL